MNQALSQPSVACACLLLALVVRCLHVNMMTIMFVLALVFRFLHENICLTGLEFGLVEELLLMLMRTMWANRLMYGLLINMKLVETASVTSFIFYFLFNWRWDPYHHELGLCYRPLCAVAPTCEAHFGIWNVADGWWFDCGSTSYFGRSSAKEVAEKNSVTERINVK